MAAPIALDVALYRMKAYTKLLLEGQPDNPAARDMTVLIDWIEFARPLLGAVSPGQVQAQVQNQPMIVVAAGEPKPADPPAEPEPSAEPDKVEPPSETVPATPPPVEPPHAATRQAPPLTVGQTGVIAAAEGRLVSYLEPGLGLSPVKREGYPDPDLDPAKRVSL